ncbi:phosphatase PAP2 family protein [Aurantimonas sp. Leaf443]|uniref:phosphatase PAP2 family protein n=1 Tax=Aurantimonas sp. Leaf443 TaxID=1736378 RepID=UPI0009EAA66B|nr:phosphatase PAP2 family protein [Aurantimonas sp. Leaf443]
MQLSTIASFIRNRVELWTLLAVLTVMAAIWVFVSIAGEVVEGDTHGFDTEILLALRNPVDPSDPIGPGWVEEIGRDATAFGGTGVLIFVTISVALFLWFRGNRRSMLLVLAAIGSGFLMSQLLKWGFDRPRPDLVPHGSIVYTRSFPSGHAMMSAVTYLTLATLLARVQRRRAVKAYLIAMAAVITVLVGVSRVYLGVHWPTDVLAGWTAGAAWAFLWWLVAKWLERRGAVDPEEDDPSFDAMQGPSAGTMPGAIPGPALRSAAPGEVAAMEARIDAPHPMPKARF